MKIKTIVHDDYRELELHVCKDTADDEVRQMVVTLHDLLDNKINATDEKGDRVSLNPGEIVSFYAAEQKVYALGMEKKFTVSRKLYELERELCNIGFIRISKSEIVNYGRIRCMDMSMIGTIKLVMKNGYETYTSRRNVTKIKELLVRGSVK